MKDVRVVESIYTGPAGGPEELQAAIGKSVAFAAERGSTRFLTDCSGLHGGGLIVDLYELAENLSKMSVSKLAREAVILPADESAADQIRFYETTVRNRGYQVRIFKTRDAALEWLIR